MICRFLPTQTQTDIFFGLVNLRQLSRKSYSLCDPLQRSPHIISILLHVLNCTEMTFRALALRRSESRNCGLCAWFIYGKIELVVTKTWNDLKPPKTTYNHLKPSKTTYNHLKKFNNHLQQPQKKLKKINNHSQTI